MTRKGFWLVFAIVLLFHLNPMDSNAQGRISIDTSHKYKGMKSSFAKGYEPTIEKDTMTLVVPFVSDTKMKGNRITVGIDFEKEENSPFYYKNYQKRVKQSKEGVYLYQCQIKLKKDRVNGQFPLHVWAEGTGIADKGSKSADEASKSADKTSKSVSRKGVSSKDSTNPYVVHQEFIIYVEITDGRAQVCGKPEENGTADALEEPQTPDLSEGGEENFEYEPPQLSSDPPQTGEEEKNSQPRLMVYQDSLQGKPLEAGSSVLWNLSIQNCSGSHAIENVKVTLLFDGKDLIFEKTSWYFERVSPKNTMDLSQSLSAVKKAAAEPVSVQFQIEYEDEKGNSYNSTETVGISVSQPQHAELANLSFPETIYASDTQILAFQVQNTGLSAVYNAKVRVEGKGLFPQGELFVGTLEGGAAAPGEIQVFAGTLDMDEQGNLIEGAGDKYGDTIGKVILSYENEQGEANEQELEIRTSIQEPKIVELKVEKEKPKTNQWWITIVAGVILALILVIVWLYLRMKYYQRRSGYGETE